MCTYITEKVAISGSAKGTSGWMAVSDSSVYLDHPVHAPFGHTLNIDFLAPELGPSGRSGGRAQPGVGARPGEGDPGRPGRRAARP